MVADAVIPDWDATPPVPGTMPTVNARPFKKPNEPPAVPARWPDPVALLREESPQAGERAVRVLIARAQSAHALQVSRA